MGPPKCQRCLTQLCAHQYGCLVGSKAKAKTGGSVKSGLPPGYCYQESLLVLGKGVCAPQVDGGASYVCSSAF